MVDVMGRLIIYHGSSEIRDNPVYGQGKKYNDYGQGFYCTQDLELAKEWACVEGVDGYVNQYEIEMNELKILNLSSEEYTILHWLALLVKYRKLRVSVPVMKRGVEWLLNNYSLDISPYDVIVGYRADDSYFSFARAFLSNAISISQLSYAMRLGKLGEQFVLKSPKAFRSIQWVLALPVESKEYYPKRKARDDEARRAYFAELEHEDVDGIYLRDLIRGEVRLDGSRLQ